MSSMKFTAPPTIASFMRSESFCRVVMGPVGSGKSTGMLMELVRRMGQQTPSPDGIRRTRFAVVRQTLQQIKQTVLKEFDTWLAPIYRFKVSENTIYFSFNDVQAEVHLIPLDDEQDQRRLLSMQLTGCWVNEFPEIDPDLIPSIEGRLGRYPSQAQGGPSWYGLIMDGNFPTEGSEWHKLLENKTPPHWQVFKQPGGLTPEAENVENLPAGYYDRLSRGQSEDWIKRYVHAQYGSDPSGSAVFRESFKRGFHTAPDIIPVHGHPIIVSQDFGRNPCALVGQLDHRGRILVLEELATEDMGLELHINRHLRPALASERYMGKPLYVIGDPAGTQRSTSYEETSFDLLKRAGLMAYPAPTNDIDKRLRSVEAFLLSQRDGGAALVIDEQRCPKLVQALGGGYRYAKRRNGQLSPLPEKRHPESDLADALQYMCLAAHGGLTNYVANKMNRVQRAPVRMSAAAWT